MYSTRIHTQMDLWGIGRRNDTLELCAFGVPDSVVSERCELGHGLADVPEQFLPHGDGLGNTWTADELAFGIERMLHAT